MRVATSSVAVNAAFLQEIKEDNLELRRLLQEVERICDGQSLPPEHRRDLSELLNRLRDQLAMHFSLEEAYGYMEDPVMAFPRLSKRAEYLRSEHGKLFAQCCELVEMGEAQLDAHSTRFVCRHLAKAFHAFKDALHHHEARENELIQEAFDQDVGVGD